MTIFVEMSKKIRYELYDAALSVEENAQRLGCSPASIRKYIRTKEIDRKFDVAYHRWKTITDYNKKNPNSTYAEKHRVLGYSINTIKRYEAMCEDDIYQSKRDTEKVSTFDIINKNSIKSVSNSQKDVLLWIMRLYNHEKPFDADLTASLLKFYKEVPVPQHLFDKYPQLPQVKNLEEAELLPNASFSSIIYDLPFIVSDETMSMMKSRFNYFTSINDLYAANDSMLNLSYRLLKSKGILVVKTMDINNMGKQYWVSDYVFQKASEMGFTLLDKFILVANMKLLRRTHSQHIARKNHSYFFVFRKP